MYDWFLKIVGKDFVEFMSEMFCRVFEEIYVNYWFGLKNFNFVRMKLIVLNVKYVWNIFCNIKVNIRLKYGIYLFSYELFEMFVF